jgi:hypothetical protein
LDRNGTVDEGEHGDRRPDQVGPDIDRLIVCTTHLLVPPSGESRPDVLGEDRLHAAGVRVGDAPVAADDEVIVLGPFWQFLVPTHPEGQHTAANF